MAARGWGVSANPENKAHGQAITDAHESEMRSALAPEREAVPVISDEER